VELDSIAEPVFDPGSTLDDFTGDAGRECEGKGRMSVVVLSTVTVSISAGSEVITGPSFGSLNVEGTIGHVSAGGIVAHSHSEVYVLVSVSMPEQFGVR
jgi:hypothetical protein